jgi:hypothetical protein
MTQPGYRVVRIRASERRARSASICSISREGRPTISDHSEWSRSAGRPIAYRCKRISGSNIRRGAGARLCTPRRSPRRVGHKAPIAERRAGAKRNESHRSVAAPVPGAAAFPIRPAPRWSGGGPVAI